MEDDQQLALSVDPDLDPETAQAVGRYMRKRFRKYRSHYSRLSSGAEIYRNKRGLCEDAPCCGCCNG